MREAHMQIHPFRGGNSKLLAGILCLVVIGACSRNIRIDLLNNSGRSVDVSDRSGSQVFFRTLSNGNRVLVEGQNPLIVRTTNTEWRFGLSVLPSGVVRTARRGLLLSVELGMDGRLYLLNPEEKPPVSRLSPQPPPFPLDPGSREDNKLKMQHDRGEAWTY